MRLTRHINDYTPGEIDATYYCRRDFQKFKRDVKRTLSRINWKKNMDDAVYCSRGLECLTKQALAQRTKRRKAALSAVLDNGAGQFFRVGLGADAGRFLACQNDDERIAIVYSAVSRDSARTAYHVGLSDERDAEKLLLDQEIRTNSFLVWNGKTVDEIFDANTLILNRQ